MYVNEHTKLSTPCYSENTDPNVKDCCGHLNNVGAANVRPNHPDVSGECCTHAVPMDCLHHPLRLWLIKYSITGTAKFIGQAWVVAPDLKTAQCVFGKNSQFNGFVERIKINEITEVFPSPEPVLIMEDSAAILDKRNLHTYPFLLKSDFLIYQTELNANIAIAIQESWEQFRKQFKTEVYASMTGDNYITITPQEDSVTIIHAPSGVTEGTYGQSSDSQLDFNTNTQFNVVSATVDSQGHITSIGTKLITIPTTDATQSLHGLMSTIDKVKLDEIGINTNNSTALTPTNELFNNVINLHKIAKTGTFSDLLSIPDGKLSISVYGGTAQEFTDNADTDTTINIPSEIDDSLTTSNNKTWSIDKIKMSMPTVNNATLLIQQNGTNVESFTANDNTNKIANIIVPTKTSDLTNDGEGDVEEISGQMVPLKYITRLTNNLQYYYTKTEIDALIAPNLRYEIVQTLPTQNISPTTIYLLPNGSSDTTNYYDEYLYIATASIPYWECIGSTRVDLTPYQTKTLSNPIVVDGVSQTTVEAVLSALNTLLNNHTHSWSSITNKPTIPTVNNATLTIQKNGTTVNSFTANASSDVTCNITVPTKTSDLDNDSGYTTNTGTVTQVKVGSTAYNPSNGIISLPAYPTDTNTHRPIQMNGTEILGNNTTALNLKAGSNITLSNNSGTVTINAASGTDTGMTSVQMTGDGNAVTTASYSASNRKLSLTKGITTLVAGSSGETAITENSNLNDYVTIGTYGTSGGNTGSTVADSLVNKPTFAGGFRMYVESCGGDASYLRQTIITKNGLTFVRTSTNLTSKTWTPWQQLASVSELPDISTKVSKSGDTMTGVLNTAANMYTDSRDTGALNLKNSNIIGVHGIYMADSSDNAGESINWINSSTTLDSLWANSGVLLFTPNRADGTSTTAANSQKVGRFTANPTTGQVVITDGTTGGIKSSGYTIATSVPSGAVFTDTKVTSSANHYAPSTVSGQDKTASASGATAAWSIDVVKGVTLNTDGKGHVTGISVTSGKIPANPNTNTTYTLSADTTNNKITLTPSSGTAQSITVPYATSATTATKLGSETVGGASKAIYLNAGTPTAGNSFVPTTGGTFNAANGTAGTEAYTTIIIGNATGTATAKNSTGQIRLYGSASTSATTAYYTQLRPGANTANRTITFPNAGGTVALTTSNITGTAANVTGTVAIVNGGTGATSAANARTNLGIGNVGTLNYASDTTKYLRNDGTWQVPPTSAPTAGSIDINHYVGGSSTITINNSSCNYYGRAASGYIRFTTSSSVNAGNNLFLLSKTSSHNICFIASSDDGSHIRILKIVGNSGIIQNVSALPAGKTFYAHFSFITT